MAAVVDEVPFIGRRDELARLSQLFDDGARLVTAAGRGGVGKTRLVREFASSGRSRHGARVTFVSFAGIRNDELTVPHIGAALGLPPANAVDPVEPVVAHLGSDEHLLVLDNLEHLPGAGRHVADLLDRCPGVRVLATSQAPLLLRSEHVLHVRPLPVPAPGWNDADVGSGEHPAVELYLAAARLADDGFRLKSDEHAVVAELCSRLEGLPLAIELAGARAATLRPADVLRCLDEVGVAVLRRSRVDAPARHHDVVAAIEWTYELLTPSQRDLLAVLAAGPGNVGIEVVMALPQRRAQDGLDDLTALVDLHLVERTSDGDRIEFEVPSSIRDVALTRAADDHALESVRRRRISAFARLAGPTADDIERGASSTVFSSKPGDGLAATLELALDNGQLSEALDLVRVLADRWDNWGYHPLDEALMERCIAESAHVANEGDVVRRARVAIWSAILGLRHRSTRSQAELVERLRAAGQVDDDHTKLFAAVGWTLVAPITGDVAAAATAIDDALERARRTRNAAWLPNVHAWAGMIASRRGDVDRAIEHGLAALRGGRLAGDDPVVLNSVLLLAPLVGERPELARELPSDDDALELARRCHEPLQEVLLLHRLVAKAVAHGDLRPALERAEEMLLLGRAMPGSPVLGFQLVETMSALALGGDHDSAVRLFGAVRPALSFVDRYDVPARRAARGQLIDQLRSAIGPDAFDALATSGSSMTSAEAVEFALTAVRRALRRAPTDISAGPPPLTARQHQILHLLAQGMSNKAIAGHLRISAKTVMHHTMAIYRRLDVSSRQEAVAYAFRTGILRSDTA